MKSGRSTRMPAISCLANSKKTSTFSYNELPDRVLAIGQSLVKTGIRQSLSDNHKQKPEANEVLSRIRPFAHPYRLLTTAYLNHMGRK